MKTIEEIFDNNRSAGEIISDLQVKSTSPPEWSYLRGKLFPEFHRITADKVGRKDKIHKDGTVDKAARISLGLEKLLCKRINQFCFTLPVKRIYSNLENDTRQQIAKAIERVYERAHINSENMTRGFAFFASCEMFTLWYTVKKPNDDYGFKSEYKLCCKTFSPLMPNIRIYPLMDEYGDMLALSVSYSEKVLDTMVDFFETWTSDKHYKWRNSDSGWEEETAYVDGEGNITHGDDIQIGKIPASYAFKGSPTWEDGTPTIREDVEYTLSRDSDVVAYNAAPILKVEGSIVGGEQKGESRRVYRVEKGGDVSYVSWNQSQEATKNHVDRMLDLYWQLNQMPDTSFKNMLGLGNIGYDARMTVLIDALLRVGEESYPLIEFFERECNVIKAFLKQMNQSWASEVDNVVVTHQIQPYFMDNEEAQINLRLKANGGKAIESQLESIERYGKSKDAKATLEQINRETTESQTARMGNLFESAV